MPTRKSVASRSRKEKPALPEPAAAVTQPDATTLPQVPLENEAPPTAAQTDYTRLPFLDHPAFQLIFAEWRDRGCVLQEFISIFAAGRYAIKSNEAFKGVLEDAFSLYDVTSGKKPASELLRTIQKHVEPQFFYAIVVDLAQYLAPHIENFVRELSGVGPHDEAKLKAVELLTAVKDWERERPAVQHRLEVAKAFELRVDELSRQSGVTDPDEMRNIRDKLSKKVGLDPEIIARVDGWDFSDVARLFSEYRKESRAIN